MSLRNAHGPDLTHHKIMPPSSVPSTGARSGRFCLPKDLQTYRKGKKKRKTFFGWFCKIYSFAKLAEAGRLCWNDEQPVSTLADVTLSNGNTSLSPPSALSRHLPNPFIEPTGCVVRQVSPAWIVNFSSSEINKSEKIDLVYFVIGCANAHVFNSSHSRVCIFSRSVYWIINLLLSISVDSFGFLLTLRHTHTTVQHYICVFVSVTLKAVNIGILSIYRTRSLLLFFLLFVFWSGLFYL